VAASKAAARRRVMTGDTKLAFAERNG